VALQTLRIADRGARMIKSEFVLSAVGVKPDIKIFSRNVRYSDRVTGACAFSPLARITDE